MTAPTESLAPPPAGLSRATLWAIGGVGLCAVIWGTTWYAITLQLGQVAPLASIVWRFGLAAILLFAGCLLTRRSLKLTLDQHLAAAGQGVFAFSISYSFTYAAEGRIASAIVAVIFASLALLNLILFRIAARQRAAALSWGGAALGVVGVAVLSGSEVLGAGLDAASATGVGFAFIGWGAAREIRREDSAIPARRAVLQAWRIGRAARWLPALDYEALFAEPLETARARLNLRPPTVYAAVPAGARAALKLRA